MSKCLIKIMVIIIFIDAWLVEDDLSAWCGGVGLPWGGAWASVDSVEGVTELQHYRPFSAIRARHNRRQ
jgi:hypothetical protein